MAKVLIVCGGTGGHLAPGIAIAEELSLRGHACALIVSHKKVDARLIQNYPGLEFIEAPGVPLSWKPLALLNFLWVQLTAFVFAVRLLAKKKPDLILGFGGFLSAGIAYPGTLQGIPFALHEANRVVGRSNRILSRVADKIFLPDGVALPGINTNRVHFAGLPLRREFTPMTQAEARKSLGINPAKKLLVVFGGSQGAGSLNNWAEEHCRELAEKGVSLYCLTGLRNRLPGERVTETTSFGAVKSWFVPFSDKMPAVLSAADAVVSRAGAGSIGEIIRCRVPAILVPYPHARDDHQTANARHVVLHNAAVVVEDSRLATLMKEVTRLLFDEAVNRKLRNELKHLDRPDEAILLADELEHLIGAKRDKQPVPKSSANQA